MTPEMRKRLEHNVALRIWGGRTPENSCVLAAHADLEEARKLLATIRSSAKYDARGCQYRVALPLSTFDAITKFLEAP